MAEVERNFAFFDVRCPEARESIFTEDPADVARRLIRPSRPAYGGYGRPDDGEGFCQPCRHAFGQMLVDAADDLTVPVRFLAF